MSECAKCNTRVDDGISKCPNCGVSLTRPGTLALMAGWVVFFASSIPIVVGVNAAEQQSYVPLGVGIAIGVVGVVMVIAGRTKMATAPNPVRVVAGPAASPPATTP